MCSENTTAIIGIISGVIIAIFTIYYSNRNTQKQIVTSKLEELYQLIQTISGNYGTFLQLELAIIDLRSGEFKNLRTLNDYYNLRDEKLPPEKRAIIIDQLSRIEVLVECYTEKNLKVHLSDYTKLIFSFFDFVSNGGSIYQGLYYKQGFPKFQEFYNLLTILKTELKNQIKN